LRRPESLDWYSGRLCGWAKYHRQNIRIYLRGNFSFEMGNRAHPKWMVLLVRADQEIHRPEAQFFMFLPIK
jgi:hypothetical protein